MRDPYHDQGKEEANANDNAVACSLRQSCCSGRHERRVVGRTVMSEGNERWNRGRGSSRLWGDMRRALTTSSLYSTRCFYVDIHPTLPRAGRCVRRARLCDTGRIGAGAHVRQNKTLPKAPVDGSLLTVCAALWSPSSTTMRYYGLVEPTNGYRALPLDPAMQQVLEMQRAGLQRAES